MATARTTQPRPSDTPNDPAESTGAPPQVSYGSEPPGHWDVTGVTGLNVRSGPGLTHAVIAGLAGDATDLASTGSTARIDGGLWRELRVPRAGTGWVNARFLTEASADTPPAPDERRPARDEQPAPQPSPDTRPPAPPAPNPAKREPATPPAREPATPPAPAPAASCAAQDLLTAVETQLERPPDITPVDVLVDRCRGGYALVWAVPDGSGCGGGGPCHENEQVLLRAVDGRWRIIMSGTGFSCADDDLPAAARDACGSLGLRPPD